ncbi:ChaN family lipoprotein [Candidatus Accumulibacter sp. ACC003]|uniref:ChaN family lipoprotein n=1 Tax=Candidatus Accumulibacter sp. ACC003 TaxID=2823334 RepID=UPI0025BA1B48|nr:ChaN family lipoprotein [Candidatus Accumulibacter sp. ACC003]
MPLSKPSRPRSIFALLLAATISTALGVLVADSVAAATATSTSAKSPTPAPACLAPASWTVLAGRQPRLASSQEVVADVVGRDVVLLGEQHDDADHHRWQLQVLAGLHAQRPAMVIGFEMFPRRLQAVLDRWVAGELSVKDFLAQSEWEKVWSQPADLYLPLFHFARMNRIPMLALNIDQALTRKIAAGGWDAIPLAEREGVGQALPPSAAYRKFLREIHDQHTKMRAKAGKKSFDDAAFANFVDSQLAWDRAMAEALASPLAKPLASAASGTRPLVVGIIGNGHLRFGHGVPHQLRDLGVPSIGVLLPMTAGGNCDELQPGLADAVFAVPTMPQPPAEPPRLGVSLDEQDGRIVIASVGKGSLAESSGLQSGDRIVEVAGQPLAGMSSLLLAIRQQQPGSWLPLQIERAGQKIEVLVKFPAKR